MDNIGAVFSSYVDAAVIASGTEFDLDEHLSFEVVAVEGYDVRLGLNLRHKHTMLIVNCGDPLQLLEV